MIIRNKKHIMVLLTMFVLIATCSIHINASAKTKLTKTQQKRVDYIASICEKNWYGNLKGLSYKKQVHQLASHGYCGSDHKAYERWVLKCIKTYNLTSYDKKMKKNLAAKNKKKAIKDKLVSKNIINNLGEFE